MRYAAPEAQRIGLESLLQDLGALDLQGLGGAIVDGVRGHQADAAVAMLVVVPVEELLAMNSGILKGSDALWELRPILQGRELRLRVRIVVRKRASVYRVAV